MNIIGEGVIVGSICMIIGIVVFSVVARMKQFERRKTSHQIGTIQIGTIQLLISLFLTGFLGHLFFEITGMNKRLYNWTGVWLW